MSIKDYSKDFKKVLLKSWTMWGFVLSTAFVVAAENYTVLQSVVPKQYHPYLIIGAMLIGRLKGMHSEVKNK